MDWITSNSLPCLVFLSYDTQEKVALRSVCCLHLFILFSSQGACEFAWNVVATWHITSYLKKAGSFSAFLRIIVDDHFLDCKYLPLAADGQSPLLLSVEDGSPHRGPRDLACRESPPFPSPGLQQVSPHSRLAASPRFFRWNPTKLSWWPDGFIQFFKPKWTGPKGQGSKKENSGFGGSGAKYVFTASAWKAWILSPIWKSAKGDWYTVINANMSYFTLLFMIWSTIQRYADTVIYCFSSLFMILSIYLFIHLIQ